MSDAPTIRVLGFKVEYIDDPKGGDKQIARDWVEYAPISALLTTRIWDMVHKMRPPERIRGDDDGKKMDFMRYRWAMIEPAYTAWKSGQDIPLDGTPLGAWPGVTAEQVMAIQRLGIRTVEEVAGMSDSVITKLPIPNPRELVKQARAFLEATDRGAAAKRLADQDSKIEALQEQLAAAMELLEEKASKPKPAKTKETEDA
jgi:hypothetical protein